MKNNLFITEKEAEELKNKIISMKGKNGMEILRFIIANLKPDKEHTEQKLKNGIDKNKVLKLVSGQEKIINELVRIIRKHREITYNYLPFDDKFKKQELDKIHQMEQELLTSFNIITSLLISYINDFTIWGEISPTIDRKIKGKLPKSKKPNQLEAEKWAKEVWEKYPSTTLEQMAIDIKDKLDLTQSIETIKRWIRPLKPKK